MRKLSNITESVWNDIRKRGNGTEVKIEDDIDRLDKDQLWDYLRLDLYTTTSSIYDIRLYSLPYDCIMVPISINGLWKSSSVSYLGLEGFENPKGKVVTLDSRSIARLTEEVVGELSKKYNMKLIPETSKRQAYAEITPKDGSPVTNTFYIEVIDFLLDNIKDGYNKLVKKIHRKINVNESVWNDIRRRGIGTDVKKEDDVDILDAEGFLQYLKDHYDSKKIEFRTDSGKYYHCFLINILRLFSNVSYLLVYNFRKKNIEFNSDLEKHYPDLFTKMNDTFRILGIDRTTYYIYDKDSLDVTNSLYIKVLNFIIDNVENKEDLLINRK